MINLGWLNYLKDSGKVIIAIKQNEIVEEFESYQKFESWVNEQKYDDQQRKEIKKTTMYGTNLKMRFLEKRGYLFLDLKGESLKNLKWW